MNRVWRYQHDKPAEGIGKYGYPMRNVVRVDVSPMNERVRVFQLECGHDHGQAATRRRPARVMECGTCPKDAR